MLFADGAGVRTALPAISPVRKPNVGRPGPDPIKAIALQPAYGKKLATEGKLECRYPLIGEHGGAWIYKDKSNEEQDLLLAMAPVFNYAHYDVLPLADTAAPETVNGKLT